MSIITAIQHIHQVFFMKSDRDMAIRIENTFSGMLMTGETTVVLLLLSAFTILSYELSKEPIKCLGGPTGDNDKGSHDILDHICLNTETYTMDIPVQDQKLTDIKQDHNDENNQYVIYPGIPVGPHDKAKRIVNSRYKFSPLLLICQALLFALPLFMWKKTERMLIYRIIQESCTKILHEISNRSNLF